MTPALVSEARNPKRACLDTTQDAERRIEFCEMAMKSGDASNDAAFEATIARVYSAAGRPEQAVEAFGRALAIDAGNLEALSGRCKTYALMGKELDTALRDCNAAIKDDRRNADAWDGLAVIAYRRGDMDAALKACNGAMDRDFKRHTFAFYMRGIIEHRLGNKQAGDGDIQTAVSFDPAIQNVFAKYGIAR